MHQQESRDLSRSLPTEEKELFQRTHPGTLRKQEESSQKSYLKRIEFSIRVWDYVYGSHVKFHIFYTLHRGSST